MTLLVEPITDTQRLENKITEQILRFLFEARVERALAMRVLARAKKVITREWRKDI